MFKRRIRRAAAGMLVAIAAATLVPVTLAAPANAAVCTHRTGVFHRDSVYLRTWTEDSVCPNAANAPVYLAFGLPEVHPNQERVGTMLTTRSWFLCWVHGAPHAGGNDIWYFTLGDVAAPGEPDAWGFMPARYVFTTHDPGDSRLGPCPD